MSVQECKTLPKFAIGQTVQVCIRGFCGDVIEYCSTIVEQCGQTCEPKAPCYLPVEPRYRLAAEEGFVRESMLSEMA
jgi:hypothetical protein